MDSQSSRTVAAEAAVEVVEVAAAAEAVAGEGGL